MSVKNRACDLMICEICDYHPDHFKDSIDSRAFYRFDPKRKFDDETGKIRGVRDA